MTFCYTTDKLESGKNIVNKGKNENLKIMAALYDLSEID